MRMRLVERLPIRQRLYDEQKGECHYCGKFTLKEGWTIDHLTPISRGGTNDESNLRGACKLCNEDKGSMTESEYLKKTGA